jgi:hypothetical protein
MNQQPPLQEKPWIVVAEDQEVDGAVLFFVRHAKSAGKACEQVQEEYQRNGWEAPASTTAYRVAKFRKDQGIQMIGKVFS